ncbi:MAG: hypothetical protein DCC65_05960 [Planctomycetota bacterium]|nr:MAG: hypothetical protein DCC65_05960 [Planctomycetota bacterium]
MISGIRLEAPQWAAVRATVWVCGAALLASSCTGCATLTRRTLAEVKGADSDASPVPGTGGHDYGRFAGVQIIPPRTKLGGLVSSEFSSQLAAKLEEVLIRASRAPFKGGSPTLTIESEILWYHRGGITTIMPERFSVVLYTLRADGGEYGRVQVVTKSGAARTEDVDLAESNARELANYLRRNGATRGGPALEEERDEDDEDDRAPDDE